MKNIISKILVVLVLITGFTSCEIDPIFDPNGPTVESYLSGATKADLQLLVSGLESVLRNDIKYHYETVSMVGRDYYDLNGIDPRYTGELIGAEGAILDNNGFLTTRAFNAAYRAIRNAYILMESAENAELSAEQRSGYVGFAKTIQAHMLLLELNRQYENGIRLDTKDPFDLGPFSNGYQDGLNGIRAILNSANSDLSSAGSEFNFVLSSGFSGFDDPAGFIEFNRALAARVDLYRDDMSGAIDNLNASFFDINGDMYSGAYHVFGSSGNDIPNDLFYVPGPDVDKYTVHPTWLTDAEAGDTRVDSKSEPYGVDVDFDGLPGNTQITLYDSDSDPVPIIRNEELILIYAEANAASNSSQAVAAIDAVRAAAGLGGYTGATDEASLINEILNQRRYSLVGEGHRWVDMRRYDRLPDSGDPDPCPTCDVPTDRPGDIVHVQFPRPVEEGG